MAVKSVGTTLSSISEVSTKGHSHMMVHLFNIGPSTLTNFEIIGIVEDSSAITLNGPFDVIYGHPKSLAIGESAVIGFPSNYDIVRLSASATSTTEIELNLSFNNKDSRNFQPTQFVAFSSSTTTRAFGIPGRLAFARMDSLSGTLIKLQRRSSVNPNTWVDTGLETSTGRWTSEQLAPYSGLFGQIDNLRLLAASSVSGTCFFDVSA